MSVEVKGFDGVDRGAVSEVSFAAAKLCVAQGMSPGEAHTTAELGARYAAELMFTVLRQMILFRLRA